MSQYNWGGSPGAPAPAPESTFWGGSGSLGAPIPSGGGVNDAGPGKFDFNLLDPVGTAGNVLGSAFEFGAGTIGGALGLVGQIGVPGGPNLGDVGEAVGGALGEVGNLDISAINPGGASTLGGAFVNALNVISLPGRAVERTVAGSRVEGRVGDLPPDIRAALDNGTLTVDQAADELVARGMGFSSDRTTNLGLQLLADPINFIGPGLGKAASIGAKAAVAIEAGEKVGIGANAMAKGYTALARTLPEASHGVIDRLLGGTTSGVAHSLGTGNIRAVRSGIARELGSDAAAAFDDALAVGHANLAADVAMDGIRSEMARGVSAVDSIDDLAYRRRVADALDPRNTSRKVEEKMDSVMVGRIGQDPVALRDQTVRFLATTVDVPVEQADMLLTKMFPKGVDIKQAEVIRLAAYGRSIDDLGGAIGRTMADPEALKVVPRAADLVPVAPDTLTADRIDALLAEHGPLAMAGDSFDELNAIVRQYKELRDHFGGKTITNAELRQFLDDVKPTAAIRLPTTGANPLPSALQAWRQKWANAGYELGFAPENGIRFVDSPDPITGETTRFAVGAFTPIVTDRVPVNVANPIGRAADTMFRGITQNKIIVAAQRRMVEFGQGVGMSPGESRAFARAVLGESIDSRMAVRGLKFIPGKIDDIAKRTLGETRYMELRAKGVNFDYAVMRAYANDARNVGLTQAFTGFVKQQVPAVAAITDAVYPAIRFTLSPVFWMQELPESGFWNLLRGHNPFAKLEQQASDIFSVFRGDKTLQLMQEAGVTVGLAGDGVARAIGAGNSRVGRILSRVNIAEIKRGQMVRQTMAGLGKDWVDTLERIQPGLTRKIADGLGVSADDAQEFMYRWWDERLALTKNATEAAERIDDVVDAAISSVPEWATREDWATAMEAFRYAFRTRNEAAIATHYFNPARGALERTLNHPYLGLYPLSYMVKVMKEFSRFLLVRPFGLNAPLVGYEAFRQVGESLTVAMAEDPGFGKALEDNKDLIYVIQMLIPGNPFESPINAPAWARHVAEGQANKDPLRFATQVPGDIMANIGIPRDARLLGNAYRDIASLIAGGSTEVLDAAARAFDSTRK